MDDSFRSLRWFQVISAARAVQPKQQVAPYGAGRNEDHEHGHHQLFSTVAQVISATRAVQAKQVAQYAATI
jgi:hypothetical protein